MKVRIIALTLFFLLSACRTSVKMLNTNKETNLAIKSSKFTGAIFKETYPFSKLYVSDIDSLRRFTPTKQEIEKAEEILRKLIALANKSRANQYRNSPIIHKKLKNYFRQYVGFISANNERIIHINLCWNRFSLKEKLKGYSDDRLKFEDDYAIVFDGGSRYWQINVNLTRRCLTDLQVNGAA